jgi:membrane protease YdiL (CAAX protease family)
LRYDGHPMASAFKKYMKETRRPIYAAALVLPFFLAYHAGTIVLNTTHINGADALIIGILSVFSVRSIFASALVLLACFIVWQIRTRASWNIDPGKLALLFLESIFYAVLLLYGFGWLLNNASFAAASGIKDGLAVRLVLYCGAGIYEELIFRWLLLSLLLFLFTRGFRANRMCAAIFATCLGALIFALFHYVGPGSDHFSRAGFIQRALGGLYFSILFITRGFGVAAASHAFYDILVGLILLH